jgi:triacylglycerol lipase
MVWAVKNGMVVRRSSSPAQRLSRRPDDIADAIFYVRSHAADYGGDPEKVVVWGHSAGASLVGFFLAQPVWVYRSGGTIAGAIMSSGGYEFKGKNPYLGSDPELLAQRSSVEGLELTSVPLFFTRAEWDRPIRWSRAI